MKSSISLERTYMCLDLLQHMIYGTFSSGIYYAAHLVNGPSTGRSCIRNTNATEKLKTRSAWTDKPTALNNRYCSST
jgi:hypothetical protein